MTTDSTTAPETSDASTSATSTTPRTTEEPTIGRLVADTTAGLSDLIHDEIALAKSELRISVKAGGLGAALFGAAAFFGVLAVVMVSIAIALLLSLIPGIQNWLAFLIVFAAYLLMAGLLGLVGLRKVKQVKPPEQTIAAVKSNKQVLKRG